MTTIKAFRSQLDLFTGEQEDISTLSSEYVPYFPVSNPSESNAVVEFTVSNFNNDTKH